MNGGISPCVQVREHKKQAQGFAHATYLPFHFLLEPVRLLPLIAAALEPTLLACSLARGSHP